MVDFARDYYGIIVSLERAQEIAAEVNVLNQAVSSAAIDLSFDCSPDEFLSTLSARRRRTNTGE